MAKRGRVDRADGRAAREAVALVSEQLSAWAVAYLTQDAAGASLESAWHAAVLAAFQRLAAQTQAAPQTPVAVAWGHLGSEARADLYARLAAGQVVAAKLPARLQAALQGGRKRLGSFYTPPALVDAVVRAALDGHFGAAAPRADALAGLRVLDPSMGCGHFLLGCARHLGAALRAAAFADSQEACERWVAAHCLFGIDCDPCAVEMAHLLFAWRQTPIPRGHLVVGDTVASPLARDLRQWPQASAPLDEASLALLVHGLRRAGRHLAQAWVGALALAPGQGDAAYGAALAHFASDDAGAPPPPLVAEALQRGGAAFALEAAFAEVFAENRPGGPGFDWIVGNPPWDKAIAQERDFYVRFVAPLDGAPTGRERQARFRRLRGEPGLAEAWEAYAEDYARLRRVVSRTYRWQFADPASRRPAGHADAYRYFVERSADLLAPRGTLAMLLPNALYNTQGATGIRLRLQALGWRRCLGFGNQGKLFDAAPGLRFCLVVAGGQGEAAAPLELRFGLGDPAALQGEFAPLRLDPGLWQRLSPRHRCVPEAQDARDLSIMAKAYAAPLRLGTWCATRGMRWYQEMNMSTDSPRFAATEACLSALALAGDPRREPMRTRLAAQGWWVVHEKGTFQRYDPYLKAHPRYLCPSASLSQGGDQRPRLAAWEAGQHYRMALRATIHAAEPRKVVGAVLPPWSVVGNSALVEGAPGRRQVRSMLVALAVANSHTLNFLAALWVGTNLNLHVLEALPFPQLAPDQEESLARIALRLSCVDVAFAGLWREVGADGVLPDDDPARRLALIAEADAMVARAFGLDLPDYAYLLQRLAPGEQRACVQAYRGSDSAAEV